MGFAGTRFSIIVGHRIEFPAFGIKLVLFG